MIRKIIRYKGEVNLHEALLEIERQLAIGMAELMKLAKENERLRATLKDIAALHDVNADECMVMARRALDQD